MGSASLKVEAGIIEKGLSSAPSLSNLRAQFVGRNVLYYPSIPTTMDVAKRIAADGAAEGTIVIADEQTKGRGRLQRSWVSPRGGNVAVSIILRPALGQLLQLPLVASLAAARGIEKVTGLSPQIKWPNDILIGGKKVCGILIENALQGDRVDWAIVGIGINVNLDTHSFPEIAATATSLSAQLRQRVSHLEVLESLLGELELVYLALRQGEAIHKEWQGRLETLGRMVRVKSFDVVEEGLAESADSNGSLLLRRPDGSQVRILAGEVTLRS